MIFGASTTHGNWDEMGGWAERIRHYVVKKYIDNPQNNPKRHVFNLGVPGDGTVKLLERIEPEIKARLFYEETIIIVSVGVNDSRINNSNKTPIVADEIFSQNQNKILEIVKKYTAKILYVGYEPVNERVTAPYDEKFSYVNERIQKFDNIVRLICEKNNIPFVDCFTPFIEEDNKKYIHEDGLHLTSAGHQKMFELIKPYLDKLLT